MLEVFDFCAEGGTALHQRTAGGTDGSGKRAGRQSDPSDQRAADRRDQPGFARGGADGTFSRRSFVPAEFDPDPDSFADGAAGRYPAVLVQFFLKKYNTAYGKNIFGTDAASPDGFAAARVAGKCAGAGERHLQRVHNGHGRFHRFGRFAGATATAGVARRGRRRLEAAVARRDAKVATSGACWECARATG